MKYRKLKKLYEEGGPFPYAQAGQVAGSLFDAVTPTNSYGVKSTGAAMGAGALKGAGTGAAIGANPALVAATGGLSIAAGAVIGGAAGAISGKQKNNQAIQAEEAANALNEQNIRSRSLARLSNYDTTGSNVNDIYAKMGGKLPIKYGAGGNLAPLSTESVEVNGPPHEKGGVDIGAGIEVEGEETIKQNFVFSKALGFADLHKPIAKAIGKMEKKPVNNITNNTIKILKGKEEALKMQQESLKEQLGIKPLGTAEMGGYINTTKRLYACHQ